MFDFLTFWMGRKCWKCIKKSASFHDRPLRTQVLSGVSVTVIFILVLFYCNLAATYTILSNTTMKDHQEKFIQYELLVFKHRSSDLSYHINNVHDIIKHRVLSTGHVI